MTQVAAAKGEGAPLLPSTDQQRPAAAQGQATVVETTLNLMKTCMGTGTLALPFAAQQGGLLLHTLGLILIAFWNLYSVHRLCQSLQYLKASYNNNNAPRRGAPPIGTSTFGKVAWFAFGEYGVHGLDFALVLLFVGIIMAYEDAVLGFLQDTPFKTGYLLIDALLIAVVVGSLSLVPDMGYLAKASAFGLSVLVATFTAIAFYAPPAELVDTYTDRHLNWWPENGMTGVSHWFGCVVFGFGVVPLTYNYYESMAQPQHLRKATAVALLGVAFCYILIGVGLLWLYYPVEGDILQQLPTGGLVPLAVRCAMIVVVVLTCPLLVLPCGMILEGKLANNSQPTTRVFQAIVRFSICITCGILSVGVPGFVYVLSFVGCFSVALVGFVIPPLVHITLVLKYNESPSIPGLILDGVMLLWGIFSTVVSSIYTFRQLYSNVS